MKKLQIQTAPVFEPLLQPSRYKGAHGGRGSAKSHFFADLAIEWHILKPGSRGVCVREVQKSLKESVKLLLEDKIKKYGLESIFDIKSDHIRTPGDGLIVFQGMADHTADSIKSLEGFDYGYCEEAHTLTKHSLEMLRPTIRKPGSELWFSWNPRDAKDPVDEFLRGPTKPDNAIVIESNYMNNPWFPAELEAERKHDEMYNPVRYGHIWLGHYEPQAVGAIWNREVIARNRLATQNDIPVSLVRILVSVDPPGKSKETSDDCGLVVVGLGEDGRGYVLADETFGPATPEQWATRAVALYDYFDADAIVGEVNNGGEMVGHTIHTVRSSIRFIEVTATRGKHIRAEPISGLYARDKVSHVGAFPVLERQLCMFTDKGYEGNGSPNNADAMIWGITELFPKLIKKRDNRSTSMPTQANNRYNPRRMMG